MIPPGLNGLVGLYSYMFIPMSPQIWYKRIIPFTANELNGGTVAQPVQQYLSDG